MEFLNLLKIIDIFNYLLSFLKQKKDFNTLNLTCKPLRHHMNNYPPRCWKKKRIIITQKNKINTVLYQNRIGIIENLHIEGFLNNETANPISNILIKAHSLKKLNLSKCCVGFLFPIFKVMFDALIKTNCLSKLNLNGISISQEMAYNLREFLSKTQSLSVLYLNNCGIMSSSTFLIFYIFTSHSRLHTLEFNNNYINNISLRAIAWYIYKYQTIKKLSLKFPTWSNDNKDSPMNLWIVSILFGEQYSLTHLNLSGTKITPIIAEAISKELEQNWSLKELNLSNTQITGKTLSLILNAISNHKSIIRCYLENNCFKLENSISFVSLVSTNTSLIEISVNKCNIRLLDELSLINAFYLNVHLRKVYMEGNYFSQEFMTKLQIFAQFREDVIIYANVY